MINSLFYLYFVRSYKKYTWLKPIEPGTVILNYIFDGISVQSYLMTSYGKLQGKVA